MPLSPSRGQLGPHLSLAHSGSQWAAPGFSFLSMYPSAICLLWSLQSTPPPSAPPPRDLFVISTWLAPFLLSLLPELALNVRSPPLGTFLKMTCPHPGLQPLRSWLLPDTWLEAGLGAWEWSQIREKKQESMDMKSWNPVPGRA